MERSLLDTDTFSEILRGRNARVRQRSESYLSVFHRLSIPVITVAEQVEGWRRLGKAAKLATLLDELHSGTHEVLAVDMEAAIIAGEISAALVRTGRPIGRADTHIAAVAIRYGMLLITGNQSHFQRIQEAGFSLRLDDWRQLGSGYFPSSPFTYRSNHAASQASLALRLCRRPSPCGSFG